MSNVNPYGASRGIENQRVDSDLGSRQMVIKRVDAVSFGKLFAAMYAIFGLIGAGFALLLLLVGVRLDAGSAPLGATIVAGLLGLIAIPLFLAVSGFIGGAIGAFFFNLAAGYVGGVKIDVES